MNPCSNTRIYSKSKPCKPCIFHSSLHSPITRSPFFYALVVHVFLKMHMYMHVPTESLRDRSHLTRSHLTPRANIGILKHFLLLFLFLFIVVPNAHTFSISSFHDFPGELYEKNFVLNTFLETCKKKKNLAPVPFQWPDVRRVLQHNMAGEKVPYDVFFRPCRRFHYNIYVLSCPFQWISLLMTLYAHE